MKSSTESQTSEGFPNRLACRMARRWVHAYTARLPTDVRDGRRAEIESDLWEHFADARASQEHRISTELDVLARVLIGIPSDLIWFSRVRRTTKENGFMQNTSTSTVRTVSPMLAVMIAAVLAVVVVATLVLFGGFLMLVPIVLLVFFTARAVRARRPSPPKEATTAVLRDRSRQHRLLATAIVSLVVIVGDIVAMNVVGEVSQEWWAWLLLVPTGLFLPVIIGATAVVLLVSGSKTTTAEA